MPSTNTRAIQVQDHFSSVIKDIQLLILNFLDDKEILHTIRLLSKYFDQIVKKYYLNHFFDDFILFRKWEENEIIEFADKINQFKKDIQVDANKTRITTGSNRQEDGLNESISSNLAHRNTPDYRQAVIYYGLLALNMAELLSDNFTDKMHLPDQVKPLMKVLFTGALLYIGHKCYSTTMALIQSRNEGIEEPQYNELIRNSFKKIDSFLVNIWGEIDIDYHLIKNIDWDKRLKNSISMIDNYLETIKSRASFLDKFMLNRIFKRKSKFEESFILEDFDKIISGGKSIIEMTLDNLEYENKMISSSFNQGQGQANSAKDFKLKANDLALRAEKKKVYMYANTALTLWRERQNKIETDTTIPNATVNAKVIAPQSG